MTSHPIPEHVWTSFLFVQLTSYPISEHVWTSFSYVLVYPFWLVDWSMTPHRIPGRVWTSFPYVSVCPFRLVDWSMPPHPSTEHGWTRNSKWKETGFQSDRLYCSNSKHIICLDKCFCILYNVHYNSCLTKLNQPGYFFVLLLTDVSLLLIKSSKRVITSNASICTMKLFV